MNDGSDTIILANGLATKVCLALGIDPDKVRRVVLDLTADNPVCAYVEMYGDQRLLSIKWELDGAKVEFSDKESSVIDDYNQMKAMSG